MLSRYLEKSIFQDLKERMVFISGPRQVGKTTLAKIIGKNYFPDNFEYLNWDNKEDRAVILKSIFPTEKKMLIFDEIHKYRNWKNYLKGEFDKEKENFSILVTGSARLDIYRKGGDSLLGRYRSYRLHPLSLLELSGAVKNIEISRELSFQEVNKETKKIFDNLFKFGGFPDVFIKEDERNLRRWHNERADRLVKEDIRDIESVRDISSIQILVELLPQKVGALFSLNSLREDLNVTHKTIASWVDILEKFYYHFRVYPFQSSLIKSLRKEPKLYLWDWSEVSDENAKLENMVASHLLKFSHYLFDTQGYKVQLNYIRDKEQREIDFVVSVNNKPWFSVEVKNSFKDIPLQLKYFSQKLKIPYLYIVVRQEGIDLQKGNIRIISVSKFLTGLI